ncbi:hypothetical protein JTB14_032556 [Gonioctena quinquepunctata]|nr:hypothetical protein JTB14_032556 [Gonioctena quinquepunctata]
MMMEARLMQIFSLLHSFHCSFYQSTKKHKIQLLYGKIHGHHLLVFVVQSEFNSCTEISKPQLTKWNTLNSKRLTLSLTKPVINAKTISVAFKHAFTMIDDKVCDAITATESAQRCYLCQATSEDFNNVESYLQTILFL